MKHTYVSTLDFLNLLHSFSRVITANDHQINLLELRSDNANLDELWEVIGSEITANTEETNPNTTSTSIFHQLL